MWHFVALDDKLVMGQRLDPMSPDVFSNINNSMILQRDTSEPFPPVGAACADTPGKEVAPAVKQWPFQGAVGSAGTQ